MKKLLFIILVLGIMAPNVGWGDANMFGESPSWTWTSITGKPTIIDVTMSPYNAKCDLTTGTASMTSGSTTITGVTLTAGQKVHVYGCGAALPPGSSGSITLSVIGTEISGTANAAVTTTSTTLADTRLNMPVNGYAGATVSCNSKTMTVTSNTATTFTGASWSGGGTPGNGNAWSIVPVTRYYSFTQIDSLGNEGSISTAANISAPFLLSTSTKVHIQLASMDTPIYYNFYECTSSCGSPPTNYLKISSNPVLNIRAWTQLYDTGLTGSGSPPGTNNAYADLSTSATGVGTVADACQNPNGVTNVPVIYGTDNTAAINAALAAVSSNAASEVTIPGNTIISAPLLIPKRAKLHVEPNAWILMWDGHPHNMVQNYNAYTHDGSGWACGLGDSDMCPIGIPVTSLTASDSTTATVAFNNSIGEVKAGSDIHITGAVPDDYNGVWPAISATSTGATFRLKAKPESYPLTTPATGNIFLYALADSDITVEGGIWDWNVHYNGLGAGSFLGNTIFNFKRVRNLTVKNAKFKNCSEAALYFRNTYFDVLSDLEFDTFSDGPHFGVTNKHVYMDRIRGFTPDDFIPFTTRDYWNIIESDAGIDYLDDVVIRDATPTGSHDAVMVGVFNINGRIVTGNITGGYAGTGYAVGDYGTLTGGDCASQRCAGYWVDSIGASGSVTGTHIIYGGGTGYTANTNYSTTASIGGGSGLQITVPSNGLATANQGNAGSVLIDGVHGVTQSDRSMVAWGADSVCGPIGTTANATIMNANPTEPIEQSLIWIDSNINNLSVLNNTATIAPPGYAWMLVGSGVTIGQLTGIGNGIYGQNGSYITGIFANDATVSTPIVTLIGTTADHLNNLTALYGPVKYSLIGFSSPTGDVAPGLIHQSFNSSASSAANFELQNVNGIGNLGYYGYLLRLTGQAGNTLNATVKGSGIEGWSQYPNMTNMLKNDNAYSTIAVSGHDFLAGPGAPTIASGGGTSPSITGTNPEAFDINVGTSTITNPIVLTMPPAVNGWSCSASDITSPTTGGGYLTKQTAGSTTSVTLTGYNASFSATTWTASDHLRVNCNPY